MQITMTRFSGQTLTANRNVDALRLRGSQGTPAGTFELYVKANRNIRSETLWCGRTVIVICIKLKSFQLLFDALVAQLWPLVALVALVALAHRK